MTIEDNKVLDGVEPATFFIEACHLNKRIDQLLKDFYSGRSRTYFQRLVEQGFVLVNQKAVKKSYKPQIDDEIEVQLQLAPELELVPQDIPLDVIYEDETIVAINKPAGMVVHPGVGNRSNTFANALLFYCNTLEHDGSLRPGIVHRLDKDTTGVLVAAKTTEMLHELSNLFAKRQVEKKYVVVCAGKAPPQGTICAPIGRHPVHRKKMAVVQSGGKEAITSYRRLAATDRFSFVEISLITGRTHQIRVHFQHIGCHVVGDTVYGRDSLNRQYGFVRQLLHCRSLQFIHPLTKKPLNLSAPLPEDINHALVSLNLDN